MVSVHVDSVSKSFPRRVGLRTEQRAVLEDVSFASTLRALALRPKLLILDEPVSALDVSVGAQIVNMLRSLQREHGLTYLFISHSMPLVRYLSTRIAVMERGRLIETEEAEALCSSPKMPFTQRLPAATPELPSGVALTRHYLGCGVGGGVELGGGVEGCEVGGGVEGAPVAPAPEGAPEGGVCGCCAPPGVPAPPGIAGWPCGGAGRSLTLTNSTSKTRSDLAGMPG